MTDVLLPKPNGYAKTIVASPDKIIIATADKIIIATAAVAWCSSGVTISDAERVNASHPRFFEEVIDAKGV